MIREDHRVPLSKGAEDTTGLSRLKTAFLCKKGPRSEKSSLSEEVLNIGQDYDNLRVFQEPLKILLIYLEINLIGLVISQLNESL